MLEELARQATGHPDAFVYYIDSCRGGSYKLLIPGQPPAEYLASTEEKAARILRRRIKKLNGAIGEAG